MVDPHALKLVGVDELLFLAPVRPRSVSVVGSVGLDGPTLDRWGLRQVSAGADVALVSGRVEDSQAQAVVASPPCASDELRSLGHEVIRYRSRRTRSGELVVRPERAGLPRGGTQARRSEPGPKFIVASRDSTVPAAVGAALPRAVLVSVVVSPHPRRRTAYLVAPSRLRPVRWVVKASVGPHALARSAEEQAALGWLSELGLQGRVPRACGHGDLDGLRWSVETVARGVPLVRARQPWWRLHGLATIGSLGDWLEELGARSSRPAASCARSSTRGIEVVGEASHWVEPLLDEARTVLAVTTHGDLATGGNVLVRGRRFTIIDWETSVRDGLPLVDLLPLLCWGLARRRRIRDAGEQAAFVIDLCEGRMPESSWLYERVRRYLLRLQLPTERAGLLAAIAWAHHGSMRERHVRSLRDAGEDPAAWTSMSELVLERWMREHHLGRRWTAFADQVQRS